MQYTPYHYAFRSILELASHYAFVFQATSFLKVIILPCVLVSMTNNNAFWMG
jgi:hypothetical protein